MMGTKIRHIIVKTNVCFWLAHFKFLFHDATLFKTKNLTASLIKFKITTTATWEKFPELDNVILSTEKLYGSLYKYLISAEGTWLALSNTQLKPTHVSKQSIEI